MTAIIETIHIIDRIAEHARRQPHAPAIISNTRTLTYAPLIEAVADLAAQLRQHGVTQSATGWPRVGLACPDGIAYVLLSLGLLRAGACVVPIAPELLPHERDAILRTLALDALVLGPGFHWPDPPGRTATLPMDERGDATLCTNLRSAGGEPSFDETQMAAMRPAFIRFSSGTTGRCKGVVLSHRTLAERIDAANEVLEIGPSDRVIWTLPMAHHFAVSMMLYLRCGAATVLVDDHLASGVLDAGRRHSGTVFYASPFHHAMLAAEPSGCDWPTMRLAISTAAPLTEPVARAFHDRFGVPLTQALGVIEVGLPLINRGAATTKPASVGRPIPAFEAELRDEAGRPVPIGEVGELHLRGPGVFDAYAQPWRVRDDVLTDGWFRTGDLARRDADGDYFLVGRTQTVINVAGMKVFAEEVEAVLVEHPQVHEARVYGRPHPQVGAVPMAQVIPADPQNPPTPASIARFCRDRLAPYKQPLHVEIVSHLDRTASGKIKRHPPSPASPSADRPLTVAILGGGPAGATLATLLAERGVNVVLYDEQRDTKLMVGESLVPALVPVFRRLGIEEKVAQIAVHKPGVTFLSTNRAPFHLSFHVLGRRLPQYAYNVPRPEFDRLLCERAVAAGAKLLPMNARVERDPTRPNAIRLHEETLAQSPPLGGRQPEWIVDCTGRRRQVARLLDLPTTTGERIDLAIFAHFENFHIDGLPPGQIATSILKHGWSWTIPLPGRTSVGVVMHRDTIRQYGDTPEEQLANVIAADPYLGPPGRGARRITEVVTYANYQKVTHRGHGANWLLLGDAFGFVDPMFSPGLFLAMRSAELVDRLLEPVVQRCVKGHGPIPGDIMAQRNVQRALRRYDREMHAWFRAWTKFVGLVYDGRLLAYHESGCEKRKRNPGRIAELINAHMVQRLSCMAAGESTRSRYAWALLRAGLRFGLHKNPDDFRVH